MILKILKTLHHFSIKLKIYLIYKQQQTKNIPSNNTSNDSEITMQLSSFITEFNLILNIITLNYSQLSLLSV